MRRQRDYKEPKCIIKNKGGGYRKDMSDEEIKQLAIRKLTPRECWRLMGFSDEAFEKAFEEEKEILKIRF